MEGINLICRDVNIQMLKQVPGEVIESKSLNECIEDNFRGMFDSNYLNCLESFGILSHNLILKNI